MSESFKTCAIHNHSNLCDGNNTLQEMCLAAWQQGVKVFGMSGHSHTPCDLEYCMTPGRTKQYKAELGRLKGMYKGKMDILCGIEYDLYSDDDRTGYDYVIGSVHYLQGPVTGRYYEIDFRPQDLLSCRRDDFGGDGLAMAKAYFENVVKMSETHPTVLGHFDLIKKLNLVGTYFNEDGEEYRTMALDALKRCFANVKLLEVNTGGVARGYRTDFYPAEFLLKAWREMGGEVIITADSHTTGGILWGYDEAAAYAKSCGYTHVMCMNAQGGFDPCEI